MIKGRTLGLPVRLFGNEDTSMCVTSEEPRDSVGDRTGHRCAIHNPVSQVIPARYSPLQ